MRRARRGGSRWFAGCESCGKKGSHSRLSYPFGMDFDASGMIIVEYKGGRIFAPAGDLSQIGGLGRAGYEGDGGPVTKASFKDMHNVAVGPDGSPISPITPTMRSVKVDSRGNVLTYAGGEQDSRAMGRRSTCEVQHGDQRVYQSR